MKSSLLKSSLYASAVGSQSEVLPQLDVDQEDDVAVAAMNFRARQQQKSVPAVKDTPVSNQRTSEPAKPGMTSDSLEEFMKSVVAAVARMNRPRLNVRDMLCYRCQQKGHFARNCEAPAPVARKDDTSASSEN